MTRGHGQEYGDCLWEGVMGCGKAGKGGKIGTTVIA